MVSLLVPTTDTDLENAAGHDSAPRALSLTPGGPGGHDKPKKEERSLSEDIPTSFPQKLQLMSSSQDKPASSDLLASSNLSRRFASLLDR